jgi:hypothetical protein
MFSEQIAAGMQWLDSVRPGWFLRTSLDRLNLATGCSCILGQEFRREGEENRLDGFGYVMEFYCMSWVRCGELGFYLKGDMSGIKYSDWQILTEEWKEAIQERRLVHVMSQMLQEQTEHYMALAT